MDDRRIRVVKSAAIQRGLRTDKMAAVWEMRVREGKSTQQIADILGISPSTVASYYSQVLALARQTLIEDVERWKLEQNHRYDHIYGEAIAAWERSKKTYTKTTKKSLRPKKRPQDGEWDVTDVARADIDDPDEITLSEEQMIGDPRYLIAAVSAMKEQGKLWGFNAPEVSQVDVRSVNVNVEGSEALDAIKAAEQAFRERKYRGNTGDLPEQSGIVVSAVREDNAPDEGSDTV